MINVERTEKDYHYMDIPKNWIPYVSMFMDEVDKLLSIYNLPPETVEYLDVKEKFNQLRIYYCIPKLMEDELTDDDYELHHTLEGIVSLLVDKYERKIKIAIEKGLL